MTEFKLYDIFIVSNLTNIKFNTKGVLEMDFGYCRISRPTQSILRQIRNILSVYPDAEIYQEAYTGTKVEGRKQFERLLQRAKQGDRIIFDSVSRMSRDAEQGTELYFELYEKGIELVFLKEQYINTETFKKALSNKVNLTGTNTDIIINAINEYLKELAKEQIKIAFEQAEKEVKDLHTRTKEGIITARQNGKQIGQKKGAALNIKKKEPIKAEIMKKSKDFNGTLTDKDLIKVLGIARNTYYKYKKELINDLME